MGSRKFEVGSFYKLYASNFHFPTSNFKKMNTNYFNIKKTFYLSVLIFLILQLLNIANGSKVHFGLNLLINFGYAALYTFSLSFTNGLVFDYLDKIFVLDRFSKKRLIIGFFATFFVSILVIFFINFFIEVVINHKNIEAFFESINPLDYFISLIITFFVILTIYAFHFYKLYQENKVAQQKIIAGTANAKFESLKNQIDPHFLFNSLNVLSSLIEENPENAQKFTTSLSKIYRYVLEQKDKELVSVEEELAFAKTYMNLLKMRFENSITFDLPTDFNNPEAKVVPLSLQLLLENTIKHNVVSEQKPLHIKIFVQENYLVVQNDLQKKEVLGDRKGVGLQNIISRYAILTNRKVIIEQTATQFSVFLPILTKQINIMETTTNFSENMAYDRAKVQVEKMKSFYGNLMAYCTVIPILIFVNLTTDSNHIWFYWPMIGWGFGLLFHGLGVFGITSNWEERKIQELLNKNKEQKNTWN